MSIPSTKILDHIVHLTPPGTVEQASQQFRDLGFNVIPGGTHTGGLTANALVILSDGVYLELLSFTHLPTPSESDRHPWAHKHPGWIDYAFLGSSTTSIARILHARAQHAHTHVHVHYAETHGGRTRPDGRVLEWVLAAPVTPDDRGTLPFFCGDVTPRAWRVSEVLEDAVHPSGVLGVRHVRVLVGPEALVDVRAQLTVVVGTAPRSDEGGSAYVWTLEVPSGTSGAPAPHLILGTPTDADEWAHLAHNGPGIVEVGFSVGKDGVEREAKTPYGKIVWSRS